MFYLKVEARFMTEAVFSSLVFIGRTEVVKNEDWRYIYKKIANEKCIKERRKMNTRPLP